MVWCLDNGIRAVRAADKRVFEVVTWDVRIGGVLSLLSPEFGSNCLILTSRKSFQHWSQYVRACELRSQEQWGHNRKDEEMVWLWGLRDVILVPTQRSGIHFSRLFKIFSDARVREDCEMKILGFHWWKVMMRLVKITNLRQWTWQPCPDWLTSTMIRS